MPLAGGPTDKFGNRYEGQWTVLRMVEILQEHAQAIRLEPPGDEGKGVEFWFRKKDLVEYDQIKRQRSASGHWSIADLAREGVLANFEDKLGNPTAHCVFISTHSAFQLDELSDRARRAASWDEFRTEFLKDQQQSTNFSNLRKYWKNYSEEESYERLKRVFVRTLDEITLRTIVESHLAILVEGDPATVVDVLAQYALERVHHQLTSDEIWQHLRSRGIYPRYWHKDQRVLAAVEAANARYISPLNEEAINGKQIPRDELNAIKQILYSPSEKRSVCITGEAGVGKSSCMTQLASVVYDSGWPMLAFRVDRLEPTQLPDAIGEQLGLPGSPANVLAAVAQGRDCALIIDQLDAVSLASGRHPQFFECINEVIKQAQVHPSMRIVIGCRRFDLDNDHRLRRLTDSEGIAFIVPVNRLTPEVVGNVVASFGLQRDRLNAKQLELLSIPLHLKLLSHIAEDTSIDALDFQTAKDLYDRFWRWKQTIVGERIGRVVAWTQVIDLLCDYMNGRQVLSAPIDQVDEYAKDAEAMASEHVLIRDGQRYAFFHESFFDYAFARRFAARGLELLPFMQSGEQHLFRRAQVRQILILERERDKDRYYSDVKVLLTGGDIRFHIKQVVFGILANLNDPAEEEWNIIAPLMGEPSSPYTREVRRVLFRSAPWFQLLDSLGLIEQWLNAQNDNLVELVVMLLADIQRQRSDRVAELVEPFIGKSDFWDKRLLYIITWSDLSVGRRFFDFFLRLIDEGILDSLRGGSGFKGDFWSMIYGLHEKQPQWTCEAISHFFNRILNLSDSSGTFASLYSISTRGGQTDNTIIVESARRVPETFVNQVLPFMLGAMEKTAEKGATTPQPDQIWRYRYKGLRNGMDPLLVGMETALSSLALNSPETFAPIAGNLRKLDFETVQYLMVRAYAANGPRFADEAVDYLTELEARFESGYFGSTVDERWATRLLIEAISPYCSSEKLEQLEAAILEYYSEWEKSVDGRRSRGLSQLTLLEAIIPERRSKAVSQRLEEWYRKFGRQAITPPKEPRGGVVGSPIPESAAKKMTDEQWLKAVARYDTEETNFERDDGPVGGAPQLARVLESGVKKEPSRFAHLFFKLPDQAHPSYFNAILQGIRDGGLDIQTVLRICRRCHEMPGRPFGDAICRVIGKLNEYPLPEELIDIVSWYAVECPDPTLDSWSLSGAKGSFVYERSLWNAGLNSVRGSAAEAIGDLIFRNSDIASQFLPTLERMVKDSSVAVRVCVAGALTATLNYDRDLAVKLFEQLSETDDVLLGTPPVENFLFYALQTHYEPLEPIVERMLKSGLEEVEATGARLACLASLIIEEARPLARLCLSGTVNHRIGAAKIFASHLNVARFRSFSEEALIMLFNDQEEKVHSEAASCFHEFEGAQMGEYLNLIEAFIQSPAFISDHEILIRALEKTTAKLPDITCQVCERFLEVVGPDVGDMQTSGAAEADTVSKLVLRVYSQTKSDDIQTRCLNIIDGMAKMAAYGLDKVLESYDR